MKQKKQAGESDSTSAGGCAGEPTIFEEVLDFQVEMCKSAGVSVDHLPASSTREMPKWYSRILEQFRKTVLKPLLKLKPKGTVNWRHFGRTIGIIERYKTFIEHDLCRILVEAGFDKITDEEWESIRPLLGEEKLRQRLITVLNRPVADSETLEDLVDEALARQFEHLEKVKDNALWLVSQHDAKTTALFFKGMAEGYTCMLDENGHYVGDRGRTNIYVNFLVYRAEIEKYRQTMPGKSRRDLQRWIIEKTRIHISNDDDWFDHFCDEICLSVKGVGRKANPQIL
jgi:hypothetical protein